MRASAVGLKGAGPMLALLAALYAGDVASSPPTASVTGCGQRDAGTLAFDLPALPLGEALRIYAETTGQPAVFPSELTDGRTSAAVLGCHRAEVALRLLLQGTGLTARQRESRLGRTFVLEHERSEGAESGSADTATRTLFADEAYAGLAQSRIWRQLCADARTRPGSYTALLRFRLATDGSLGDIRVLGGSGDAARDAALRTRLARVRVGRAPPAELAGRELTMAVLPRDPGGPQCAATGGDT